MIPSTLRTAANPALRAWMDAHTDKVSAAVQRAAPKLKPPKPYRYTDTAGRPIGDIHHFRHGHYQDAHTKVWVNDAAHPSWLMQTGTNPTQYMLQPWGILLSREDALALPGLWRDADVGADVGDMRGDLVVILDIGDGHGPLPRFAKSDGLFARIKIGRRSWRAMPSEAQRQYIGKHAAGGSAIFFDNDRLNWTINETTAARRPASASLKRLSEVEKQEVDQIVLSLIFGNFPRGVAAIVDVLLDMDGIRGDNWKSTPRARWVEVMDDASYSKIAAEAVVRASLARSEKAGKLRKVEGGWLRART